MFLEIEEMSTVIPSFGSGVVGRTTGFVVLFFSVGHCTVNLKTKVSARSACYLRLAAEGTTRDFRRNTKTRSSTHWESSIPTYLPLLFSVANCFKYRESRYAQGLSYSSALHPVSLLVGFRLP